MQQQDSSSTGNAGKKPVAPGASPSGKSGSPGARRSSIASSGSPSADKKVEKSRSFSRKSTVKKKTGKNAEAVEEVDPFTTNRRIDVWESDRQLQYTHHALESAVLEIDGRPVLKAKGLLKASLPIKFVERIEKWLQRARYRLKGDVCSRLLNIIKRVVDVNKKNRIQRQMQNMTLETRGVFQNSELVEVPSGMQSPRASLDAASRIQHFDRLREESARIHHMHPAQLLQVKEGPQKPLELGELLMPFPDMRRSGSAATRRAHTPGALSSMAQNVRAVNKAGSVSEVRMVGQYQPLEQWEDFVTRWVQDAPPPTRPNHLGDLRLSPNLGRARSQPEKRRITSFEDLVSFGSEPPPPILSGDTGGFGEKKIVSTWKRSGQKDSSGKHKNWLLPGSAHDEQESADKDAEPVLAGVISLIDLGPVERKGLPKSGIVVANKLHARTGLRHGRRSSQKAEHREPEKQSEGSKVYDANVEHLTQHFLQTRGFEKPQTASCRLSQDAALRKLLADAVNPPGVQHSRCVPFSAALKSVPLDNQHLVQRCTTPEVGYVQACLNQCINPHVMKFFSERSTKLDLSSYLVGDDDLQAVMDSLLVPNYGAGAEQHRPGIREIILSGNRRLSDSMLSRFITTLLLGSKVAGVLPCVHQVRTLCFSNCTGLGSQTFDVICNLLRQQNLRHLEDLDFKGVRIPDMSWDYIIESIGSSFSLRKLNLAQTGCGFRSQSSCCAVANLIGAGAKETTSGCHRLERVDISGNHFRHEGCAALGESLKHVTDVFEEFDLSHNAGFPSNPNEDGHESGDGHTLFNPVMHVLETLGETTVRKVAFANCQLSYEEDCILEDSVASSDITHIELSDNPHGEHGLRCLIRMLCRKRDTKEQIKYLGISTVRNSKLPPDLLKFDFVDPSASYRLSLRNPQHRSMLKMLLKRSEECGGKFTCFSNEELDGRVSKLESLCSKRFDRGGDDWQVPLEGVMTFFFLLPPCYTPKDDVKSVFRKFESRQKIKVGFDGFARLLRLYLSLPDERSHMVMLLAMSRDLVLKPCQLRFLGQATPLLFDFIVVTLMSCILTPIPRQVILEIIDQTTPGSAKLHMTGIALARRIKGEVSSLLSFNAMHSDGHYDLNLDNLADRGTAQRCMVISNWVRNQCAAQGRVDLSEHGNGDCLRHTTISRTKFVFDSTLWQLPDEGQFVFDLVLPRLPLNADDVLDSDEVQMIKQVILQSQCNFLHKCQALRLIAHRIMLRPMDLVEIIKCFPLCLPEYRAASKDGFRPRVEAFVILYNRTLYHASVVSPHVLFNPTIFHREEAQEIRSRLGWLHTFDLVNLHLKTSNLGNRHGPFDMSQYEGWILVKLLIQISFQEQGINFYDCIWTPKANMYERGYAFCIPKDWVPNPPHYGDFTGTFQSKPEEVNYTKRREMAASFLGWTWPPERQCLAEVYKGARKLEREQREERNSNRRS